MRGVTLIFRSLCICKNAWFIDLQVTANLMDVVPTPAHCSQKHGFMGNMGRRRGREDNLVSLQAKANLSSAHLLQHGGRSLNAHS